MTYESCEESCDKWLMNHVENCVKINESCKESYKNVLRKRLQKHVKK